ncbi:hypothetical protein KTN05_17815, partial [Paracoccus sp. Z118]|uniref:hypothetical protein n=1 Tax=Paracoccus sp. Z118 TaxID=2851017 RepID=UPI001C2BC0CE
MIVVFPVRTMGKAHDSAPSAAIGEETMLIALSLPELGRRETSAPAPRASLLPVVAQVGCACMVPGLSSGP